MSGVYKIIELKKGDKTRRLYVPDGKLRAAQDVFRLMLEFLQQTVDVDDVAHGFRQGRSPVTNAMRHVGKFDVTITMDLKDFFESCNPNILLKKLSPKIQGVCLVFHGSRGRYFIPQGFPTSPLLANIAAAKLDRDVIECLNLPWKRRQYSFDGFVYTRYADDLTVSLPSAGPEEVAACVDVVSSAAKCLGLEVNEKKTTVYWSKSGRRVVTGVAVDEHGVHPTRMAKRKLRAARHQNKQSVVTGMEGWIACKPPKEMR